MGAPGRRYPVGYVSTFVLASVVVLSSTALVLWPERLSLFAGTRAGQG